MKEIRNIILIGFMGAGKTIVGKSLASVLAKPFIDTDKMVEESVGVTIQTIFETLGEERFRELESEVVENMAGIKGAVIATGGGIVKDSANIAFLKKNGFVVYLFAGADVLYQRILEESGRPLADRMKDQTDLEMMLAERDPLYRKAADLLVDTTDKTVKTIENEIFEAIGY